MAAKTGFWAIAQTQPEKTALVADDGQANELWRAR